MQLFRIRVFTWFEFKVVTASLKVRVIRWSFVGLKFVYWKPEKRN